MEPGTDDLYSGIALANLLPINHALDGYIEQDYRTPKLPKQIFKPSSRI